MTKVRSSWKGVQLWQTEAALKAFSESYKRAGSEDTSVFPLTEFSDPIHVSVQMPKGNSVEEHGVGIVERQADQTGNEKGKPSAPLANTSAIMISL